jgi:hypothetical protein
LRNPTNLEVQARARGFRPPTQVIVLRDPTQLRSHHDRTDHEIAAEQLPSVAAGPRQIESRGDWQ